MFETPTPVAEIEIDPVLLFKCEICGINCFAKDYYDNHQNVHNGIKPFKCTLCDYAAHSKGTLIKHNRKIHGIRIVPLGAPGSKKRRADEGDRPKESNPGVEQVEPLPDCGDEGNRLIESNHVFEQLEPLSICDDDVIRPEESNPGVEQVEPASNDDDLLEFAFNGFN